LQPLSQARQLRDWALIVETPDGTTAGRGEEVIDLFLDSLEANTDALGPSVSAEPDRGLALRDLSSRS
jgi:hypothetical protein